MSKFRRSAKGQTCTLESWLAWEGGHDPETVVLAHAPHPDKGRGIKGPDTWAAFLCSKCHDEMDMRTRHYFIDSEESQRDKESAWFHAIRETQRRWHQMGLLPND